MNNGIWRTMVILHRYLGIAIGLLMVMWFISGIVMMYVPYSRVQEVERLHMQPPISWQSCCNYGSLLDDAQVTRAQVESLPCGCAFWVNGTFYSISPTGRAYRLMRIRRAKSYSKPVPA